MSGKQHCHMVSLALGIGLSESRKNLTPRLRNSLQLRAMGGSRSPRSGEELGKTQDLLLILVRKGCGRSVQGRIHVYISALFSEQSRHRSAVQATKTPELERRDASFSGFNG